MPASCLRQRSVRVPAVAASLALALAAAAPVFAGSLPRSLAFKGELVMESFDEESEEWRRGALLIRGDFRADRTRITLKGRGLPAPESGEYALVLLSGDEQLVAARFAPDDDGRVAFRGEIPAEAGADPRLFGVSLDGAMLMDGEGGIAEAAFACAVKATVVGRMQADGDFERSLLTITGEASRSENGRCKYRCGVSLRGFDAGEYVLLLDGPEGEFALEFELSEGRGSTRTLRFSGADDLVDAFLAFEEMTLFRVVGTEGEEERINVMSGPIDCR